MTPYFKENTCHSLVILVKIHHCYYSRNAVPEELPLLDRRETKSIFDTRKESTTKKRKTSLYVLKNRDQAISYRKISDTRLYETKDETDNVYEFCTKCHEPSAIMKLVSKIDIRRNAIQDERGNVRVDGKK